MDEQKNHPAPPPHSERRSPTSQASTPPPSASQPRRRRLVWIVVVVLIVIDLDPHLQAVRAAVIGYGSVVFEGVADIHDRNKIAIAERRKASHINEG